MNRDSILFLAFILLVVVINVILVSAGALTADWTGLGIIVAAGLTLSLYTFLYKDNPLFKFAEHIYVGVAAAYATLANGGVRPPLHAIRRIIDGDRVIEHSQPSPERVTSAEHAFLVSWMLQSTLDHGTAAEARRAGFMHDAAGKTGTTDDFRDAWFAGFTPNLLAVVWVGMDDASPLGLTGAQAALPIWTDFMKQALDGRPPGEFRPPAGIQFVEVDPVTGLRATPSCPAPLPEAFLQGTAPTEYCHLH